MNGNLNFNSENSTTILICSRAMKNGDADLSNTLHTGGIRAMLDNADAGLGGGGGGGTRGLSDEVKAYIASHFQA